MGAWKSLRWTEKFGILLAASAALAFVITQSLTGGAWAAESGHGPVPSPTTVSVQGGKVTGAVADGVLSFKGIPFAAPPVGPNRWRPPQPVKAWSGVRQATSYGPDCMQVPFPSDAAPLGTKPSEDCLYLNVWRPAETSRTPLPVMVWIYGGGFVNGGASPAVYDGSQFAKQGVILVSFNYRVGRFGFFAFPALTKEAKANKEPLGNYTYMDEIAALKWVQDNIKAFGGDPDNVTVFGESAGGASVLALLASPAARGLFAKAICEFGGGRGNLLGGRPLSTPGPNGQPSAEQVGVKLAESLGIDGTGPAALEHLRAVSAEKITNGLNMATMGQAGGTYVGGPILDGEIVTATIEQALKAGSAAKVPVMIGANSADIGFGFAKTMDEALAPFGDHAAEARKAYDPDNTGDVRAVASKIAMDKTMIEPARFVARMVELRGRPAYVYRFSYVAKSMRGDWKTGAPHASEIPYVFDTVKAKYGDKLAPEDEAIAQAANTYWANFAKTGNPNGKDLPTWPEMAPNGDSIIDFNADGPKGEIDPWARRLDLTAMTYEKAE